MRLFILKLGRLKNQNFNFQFVCRVIYSIIIFLINYPINISIVEIRLKINFFCFGFVWLWFGFFLCVCVCVCVYGGHFYASTVCFLCFSFFFLIFFILFHVIHVFLLCLCYQGFFFSFSLCYVIYFKRVVFEVDLMMVIQFFSSFFLLFYFSWALFLSMTWFSSYC